MDGGAGALREIFVVLAIGLVGLLVALAAVFGPWYPASSRTSRANVVELHTPTRMPAGAELTAATPADHR
jgi:hypothetical protein